jgi:hypothetical protein
MSEVLTAPEKARRKPAAATHATACRWTRVDTMHADGHIVTQAVWICEYPYPTMLLAKPKDCDGCPLLDQHSAA